MGEPSAGGRVARRPAMTVHPPSTGHRRSQSRGLGRAIFSRAASPSNTSVTGVTAEGCSPEAA
jgi:hypothetical protein